MGKQALTELSVRKFTAKTKRYEIWDTKIPGFGLRVSLNAVKSFYRYEGIRKRITIGTYPEICLTEARTNALEFRSKLARGKDPQSRPAPDQMLFSEALPLFMKLHCELKNKPSTQHSTRLLLERECLPIWKSKPVKNINRSDVNAVLDKMVARGSPGAANKARAAMSKFFRWCESRDFIQSNPCHGVEAPMVTQKRDRVLDDNEIIAVWKAAEKMGYPFGNIVQLLLLTAQRRGEVSKMEWGEVDIENALWTLPAERTKNSAPHHLPLPPTASRILDQLPRLHDTLVFPARGNHENTFSGFGKSKATLDELINIPHWTLHDLRRTATTKMAELEVLPHVAERVLNHSSGQFGGVAGIYNRYKYLKSMGMALYAWDDHIQNLVAE